MASSPSNNQNHNNDNSLTEDEGILTSLRYYDALRQDHAANVTRQAGVNLDKMPLSARVTAPQDEEQPLLICHLVNIKPLTRGDRTLYRGEVEDFTALTLAAHHLNTGNTAITPELQDLPTKCPIRFTVETADTQYSGGYAVKEVVDRATRQLPDRIPCAFVGAYRSAVSIPTAITSGVFGIPQITPGSTSTQLDDPSLFPLFGRTTPSDAGNALAALRYFIDVLELEHIAVLHVNDAYGNGYVDSLRKAHLLHAPDKPFDIRQIPMDKGDEYIPIAVDAIKESQFRYIFCIVFTAPLYDAILTEAVLQGVAGNGLHTWMFSNTFVNLLNDRTFEKDGPLHKAYQGTGIIESTGGVPGMPTYDTFTELMQQLKNPTDLEYIESLLPKYPDWEEYNTDMLFEDNLFVPVTNGYAPFSYDAGIALGLSACRALELYGGLLVDEENDSLETTLFTGAEHFHTFKDTTFQGVSGQLVFNNITGTREQSSNTYVVGNYRAEDAGLDPTTGKPMVQFKGPIISMFKPEGWQQEPGEAYIFNDGTTTPPVDIAPADEGTSGSSTSDKLGLAIGLPLCVVVICAFLLLLVREKRRKKKDAFLWKVALRDLQFSDPLEVIGQGSFGRVLLAEYRGTQVAVKQVLPPSGPDGTTAPRASVGASSDDGDHRSVMSSGSGTKSWAMASGANVMKSGKNAAPLKSQAGGVLRKRKRSIEEFCDEMVHLSKLRHPCVTTVMGTSNFKLVYCLNGCSGFLCSRSSHLFLFLPTRQTGAVIDTDNPMMIMEYMEHGSLYDLLHNETMILEPDLLIHILRDITQGLRFLHSAEPQVLHSDLKSANILVDGRFRAKVSDFGLSLKKSLGGKSYSAFNCRAIIIEFVCFLTLVSCSLGHGTPYWMAPELLRGESTNTAASDAYSFGIILYEVFARRDPYEGEDPNIVLKGVMDPVIKKRPPIPSSMSDQLSALMTECLEDDPTERPTFEEMDVRIKRVKAEAIGSGDMKGKAASLSLFDVFPRHIAEALRDGRKVEAEHKESVTIFFSGKFVNHVS